MVWYNLAQKQSGNRAIITKLQYENIQAHILFLKTDYFHMVNPPEHRLVETVRDEPKYVHQADVHEGMEKSKWFVTEVQAFEHQVGRNASGTTSPTVAVQEYL